MLEIIDCVQGDEAWFAARQGLPTASEFATLLAKGRTAGAESLTRRAYLYRLAGEIVTGETEETYSNGHMERGKVMEPRAREMYAFMENAEPQLIGFLRNGRCGGWCGVPLRGVRPARPGAARRP